MILLLGRWLPPFVFFFFSELLFSPKKLSHGLLCRAGAELVLCVRL